MFPLQCQETFSLSSMADLGLLTEYEYLFERKLLFCLNNSTFLQRQLDISSCDLPAKDTVRYAEDQITTETNKEHSMSNGEQLLAITIAAHQRGKRKQY